MPKRTPTADTRDEINAQLEATEKRLNREQEAWERKAAKDPKVKAAVEHMRSVPQELKNFLAQLSGEGLSLPTTNRLMECIAQGCPDDLTMRVLARVVGEAMEPGRFSMQEQWGRRYEGRVSPELEKQARFWLAGYLRTAEGGHRA